MTKDSKRWMQRHVKDPYVKSATEAGYRSRAAYKLLEVIQKYQLLKPGMAVIDLGSAPGGWSQVLAGQLAKNGEVIALDRLNMESIPGVSFIQGDFTEQATLDELLEATKNSKFDWIFSDMAPNISGIKARDQAECLYLVELVIDLSVKVLQDGGGLFIKVFQGSDFSAITAQLKSQFQSVRTVKPKASRDESREVYLLATGYNQKK